MTAAPAEPHARYQRCVARYVLFFALLAGATVIAWQHGWSAAGCSRAALAAIAALAGCDACLHRHLPALALPVTVDLQRRLRRRS